VFWELLDNYSPDAVVACETWLDPSIKDNEIITTKYKLYRCDRSDGYGGVFIAVNNDINCQPLQLCDSCELYAVKLFLPNNHSLIIIGAYRPPNRDIVYAENLCNTIYNIVLKHPNSIICCLGDFNLPDIDWNTDSICSHRYPLAINQLMLKTFADCSFNQMVDSPTRDQNILDIFLTNRPNLIHQCSVEPGICDHDMIYVSVSCKVMKSLRTDRKLYLWNRANFDEIRLKFSTLISSFIEESSIDTPVEDLWTSLCTNLKLVLDEMVPSKMVSGACNKPWINRTIKQIRRRKQKCYNLAKRTKSSTHWNEYKLLKKQMQQECRKAHNNYMHRIIYEPYQTGRKKKFFQHIKSLRRDSKEIPTLEKDGKAYSTDFAKANVLNQYFYSVFTQDDSTTPPEMGNILYPDMSTIEVDTAGIAKLLLEIDPYKATGPDKIPPRLLKELSYEISPCLSLVFRASLKQAVLPSDWKTALVTPLFKKGSRCNPCNYRPISLTSVCCKVLEHIIYSSIMSHLTTFNIISECQYGFRAKRSAELQLIRTIHDFAFNLNNKVQTDVIMLDFCKAFDKVSHRFLLHKLHYYGVRGPVLQWISAFLNGRTQSVVYNGSTSTPVNVTSGVPQGTVLGPLLFLVYINDLPDRIVSSCSLFADDCLLYRKIYNKADQEVLQQDLQYLQEWADKWLMTFNVNKCEILQISLNHSIMHYSYLLYDQPLKLVNEARYLGIMIDSKLNFNTQVHLVCKKANNALSFLKRNLYSCQREVKAEAYQIYVRPILEYATCAWAPHTQSNIDKLEAVQRRAARFVTGDFRLTSSVTQMLTNLKWDSLNHRRNVSKLQMMYKIIHEIVDLTLPDYITLNRRVTRGHEYKLTIPTMRIDPYRFSFFPSTIQLWNNLQPVTVCSRSITEFNNLLLNDL